MSQEKKKHIVKEPNSLAEATGTKTRAYLDSLYIVLSLVAQDPDEQNLKYTFNVNDHREQLGLNESSTKNDIRKFVQQAEITLKNNDWISVNDTKEVIRFGGFHVFQSVFYYPDTCELEFLLTEPFRDYINATNGVKGKKIYFALVDILRMKSEYAKKMYPILLERVHKKDSDRMTFNGMGSCRGKQYDTILTVERFKELLGVPDSYKTSGLKTICTTIVNEINDCTDFQCAVEYNDAWSGTRGRRPVTHICWLMEQKKKDIVDCPEWESKNAKPDPDDYDGKQDELLYGYFLMQEIKDITGKDEKFSLDIAMHAKKHERKRELVIDCCQYAMKQKGVKNLGGFIKWLIDNEGPLPDVPHDADPEQKSKRSGKSGKSSSFNNFPQRQYPKEFFEELESKLF